MNEATTHNAKKMAETTTEINRLKADLEAARDVAAEAQRIMVNGQEREKALQADLREYADHVQELQGEVVEVAAVLEAAREALRLIADPDYTDMRQLKDVARRALDAPGEEITKGWERK